LTSEDYQNQIVMRKITCLVGALLWIAVCCMAQTSRGLKNKQGYSMNGTQISLGAGISMPDNSTIVNMNALNMREISASIYRPFSIKAQPSLIRISLGINAGFQYGIAYGDYQTNYYSNYTILGQRTQPTVTVSGTESTKNRVYRVEAGPQLNLHLGKFVVSSIVNVGYMRVEQEAIQAMQRSSVRQTLPSGNFYDTNMVFKLHDQAAISADGWAIVPKLRLSYGGKWIGFWVEGNYTMGSAIATSARVFTPQGGALTNAVGERFYTLNQIRQGASTEVVGKGISYKSMGAKVGLSFSINRKHTCLICGGKHRGKCKDGYVDDNLNNSSIKESNIDEKLASDNSMQKNWDGTIKGLFAVNDYNIAVEKRTGIKKLLVEINKKGKASLIKINGQDFIKISVRKEDIFINDYFIVEDAGQFMMIGGVGGSGSYGCESKKCIAEGDVGGCHLEKQGPVYVCECNIVGNEVGVGCNFSNSRPRITDYLLTAATSYINLHLENDGKTVSSSSEKRIGKMITEKMPTAQVVKSEIIKENDEQFLMTTLTNNGNNYIMFSAISKWISDREIITADRSPILLNCIGTCASSKTNCNIFWIATRYPICNCSRNSCGFILRPLDTYDIPFVKPILLNLR
jgi:hypothetical protein